MKFAGCPCTDLDPKADIPYPILPIEPGSLLSLIPPEQVAPAEAPIPPLEATSIVDPPLPAVAAKNESNSDSGSNLGSNSGNNPPAAPAPSEKSSALVNAANRGLSMVAIMVVSLLSMRN